MENLNAKCAYHLRVDINPDLSNLVVANIFKKIFLKQNLESYFISQPEISQLGKKHVHGILFFPENLNDWKSKPTKAFRDKLFRNIKSSRKLIHLNATSKKQQPVSLKLVQKIDRIWSYILKDSFVPGKPLCSSNLEPPSDTKVWCNDCHKRTKWSESVQNMIFKILLEFYLVTDTSASSADATHANILKYFKTNGSPPGLQHHLKVKIVEYYLEHNLSPPSSSLMEFFFLKFHLISINYYVDNKYHF
ncbi:MAG: replication protein [Cressdnaviricota sp.]|nr:MAG: replication protein [Cressdnaviricota sp.]